MGFHKVSVSSVQSVTPQMALVVGATYRHKCEYADGLQAEEHIFWDCKRYKEQRTKKRGDILSENNKKEYTESVTQLLRLEGKKIVQGVC
jgi:hypothetical protein